MGKKHDRIARELGAYVRDRYTVAYDAKQDVTNVLLDCLRQVRGESMDCDEIDPDIDVNFNITSPIVKGIVGLVRDVFGSSVDKPFVVKSTPIPDLDEAAQGQVMQQLQQHIMQLGAQGLTQEQFVGESVKIGEQLKSAALKEKQNIADKAADKMNTLVQDKLVEANWTEEFGDFIQNFVTYPTAILKSPALKYSKRKKWNGHRLVVENAVSRCVENISPFDFYPAPNCSNVEDAEYVIEIRRCTRSELLGYSILPGFDRDGIEKVYVDYPTGWKEIRDGSSENPETDDASSAIDEQVDAQGYYDCLGYYGRIRGDLLAEFGVLIDDEDLSYEAEIWTVNDIPIKAVLNPDPLGKRPFHNASFEPIPGAFWGECPVTRLKDVQRVCTATTIALVRNMGIASGVLGEVDLDRVEDDDDPYDIQPNVMRGVKSVSGQNVYRFHQVPDISVGLRANLEAFMQYGYEIIGIPRMAFGSTENVGTLGRTSGGIAMVLNQASKSIKFALRVLEENIIEPVVQSYIDHELMFSFDETIKGDIKVYARGVSGIIEKENTDSKLQWALQSMSAYMNVVDPNTGQPIVPPAAVQRMLYEIFKSAGINTDGIFPDFDLQSALNQDMASIAPMIQGGTIDGRNAQAGQTIANSNSMTGSGQGSSGQPGGFS